MRSLLLLLCLRLAPAAAQDVYRVHAHNDYAHALPFWEAYAGGAESIEVDVFLRHDSLYVTHAPAEIVAGRTLETLYLDELQRLAARDALRDVQLLIDVKSEAAPTLERLVATLKTYPRLIDGDRVTFVVSGNRPAPEAYGEYPDFILFDHQNPDDLDRIDRGKVALLSLPFPRYSRWNGYGKMTAGDGAQVQAVLEKAKAANIPFRFWASPDTETAWATLARLGVAYVNTDRPAAARAFLDELPDRVFRLSEPGLVYTPSYTYGTARSPRNVILMVGDGNGLSQISAARRANGGQLTLNGVRTIGLVGTASADDAVTDSAAAGTALATGRKTNNRSIGVDTAGQPLPTLVEELSGRDYLTGIVTTDAVYGATPAAFYAHTPERDDTDHILGDLLNSPLSFFVAGGATYADRIGTRYTETQLSAWRDLRRPTAVYGGKEKMPSVLAGRGDFLPDAVDTTLAVLARQDRPFFLLVEGAQIDNGGHANDIATVITEVLDFDRAVAAALRFADADGQTLVIVTADHETGGLGLGTAGDENTLRADFLSVDHTGTLVPLFVYGPGATAFAGVLENTDVHRLILESLLIR